MSLVIGGLIVAGWPSTAEEWRELLTQHLPDLAMSGGVPFAMGIAMIYAGRVVRRGG